MDSLFKWVITAFGGVITFLFGAWSLALNILIVLVVFDYLTGMAAGAINGQLKSRIGLVGIARKVFIFVMVAVSHMVDLLLIENKIEVGFAVMSMTIVAYCLNEILSIIENAGKMGIYIPDPLTKAIAILRNKPEEVKSSPETTIQKDKVQ
ncbi:phage holin family protein [Priestia flexa]|uniref:phage holin family protein n=1 Tax=Priestia flexa TaxID=86664 RepID=UPI003D289483